MLTITNRTRQLLIVAKNSGPSLYLAPGEGAVVPRTEIDGNTKIDKLVKSGALSVADAPQPAPEAAAEPSSEDASERSTEEHAHRARKAKLQKR